MKKKIYPHFLVEKLPIKCERTNERTNEGIVADSKMIYLMTRPALVNFDHFRIEYLVNCYLKHD